MKKFLKRLLAYSAVVALAFGIGSVDASTINIGGSHPVTALNSATQSEFVTVGATTTELDAENNLRYDGTSVNFNTVFQVGGTTPVTGTIFNLESGGSARDIVTSVGLGFHFEADTQAVNAAGNGETVAIGTAAFLGIQTWTSVGTTMTISDMTTLYIQGPPVDSTNITATRTHAFWVDDGLSRLDGGLTTDGTALFNNSRANVDFTVQGQSSSTVVLRVDADQGTVGIGNAPIIGAMLGVEPGFEARDIITSVGMGIHIETDTWGINAAGNGETVAIGSLAFLGIPTWTSVGLTMTISDATTLYVQGPPDTTDANITATRSHSFWVDTGNVRFDETLTVTGITTHGGNVISDTDSTDDLGTTTVAWSTLWTDVVNLTGSISGDVKMQAPATVTDYTITWPAAVAGAGEQLTDAAGDGILSWAVPGGTAHPVTALNSATVSELVTVGVTTTELDAESGLTYDGTTLIVATDLIMSGVSTIFINGTQNANMAIGVTIDQDTSDDQILSLKSNADVSHGLTTGVPRGDVEVDDFFTLQKYTATGGGAYLLALAENNTQDIALGIDAYGGLGQTTDTTTSLGLITMVAAEHSGTNTVIAAPTDQNIFVIRSSAGGATEVTRLILKGDDGELHLGVATTVGLQNHDDIRLISDFENFRTIGQLEPDFLTMKASGGYDRLVEIGLIANVTEEEWNNGVRPLYAVQRSMHLLNGAVRQGYGRMEALLDVLETRDPSLRAAMRTEMAARGLGHLAR